MTRALLQNEREDGYAGLGASWARPTSTYHQCVQLRVSRLSAHLVRRWLPTDASYEADSLERR